MKATPVKRHLVDVYRLPKTTSVTNRGQRLDAAAMVANGVPCSIEPLSGRELETARQQYAAAAYRIRMHGESSWGITASDYLVRDPEGTRIDIGFVNNPELTHFEYILLGSEEIQAA